MKRTILGVLMAIAILATFTVNASNDNRSDAQKYETVNVVDDTTYQVSYVGTVTSFKDTTKNYTYENVYMVVNSLNFNRSGGVQLLGQGSNVQKWQLNYNVMFFATQTSYQTGKSPIAYWTGNITIDSTSLPSEANLLTLIRNNLPQ